MNELIEKFIAESTICQEDPQIDGSYFDKEKFAELIVRECALACETAIFKGQSNHMVSLNYAWRVKQHFGIK